MTLMVETTWMLVQVWVKQKLLNNGMNIFAKRCVEYCVMSLYQSFCTRWHWNCHRICLFLIKDSTAKMWILYQQEFLQILSTSNVIKKRYSIWQFVMTGQNQFSEGMFRDDNFWDPWRGSAIWNWPIKRKPYLSKIGAAFDQMKMTSMTNMAIWERSGIMLYSTTSNRNQISVAPARTPADKFLFFHSRMSAAANPDIWIHNCVGGNMVHQIM